MDIRQVKKEETKEVATMIAKSMLNDPIWVTMIPAENKRLSFLNAYSKAQVQWVLKNGIVEVTDSLTAAALWAYPGRQMPLSKWLDFSLARYFVVLDVQSQKNILEYLNFTNRAERTYVDKKAWRLVMVAVDEAHQRQGIARVLVRKHTRRLNVQNTFAYALTHSMICKELFLQVGFREVEIVDFLHADSLFHVLEREPKKRTDLRI